MASSFLYDIIKCVDSKSVLLYDIDMLQDKEDDL